MIILAPVSLKTDVISLSYESIKSKHLILEPCVGIFYIKKQASELGNVFYLCFYNKNSHFAMESLLMASRIRVIDSHKGAVETCNPRGMPVVWDDFESPRACVEF